MRTHRHSATGNPPLYKGERFALWREGREDPLRPGELAWGGEDCLVDLETGAEARPEVVARYIFELEREIRREPTSPASPDPA